MMPQDLIKNWEGIARDMEVADSRGAARLLRKDSNVYNDCAHMLKSVLKDKVVMDREDLERTLSRAILFIMGHGNSGDIVRNHITEMRRKYL